MVAVQSKETLGAIHENQCLKVSKIINVDYLLFAEVVSIVHLIRVSASQVYVYCNSI